jgi:hypothetical protein
VRTCTNVTSNHSAADDTMVGAGRSPLNGLLREVSMPRIRGIFATFATVAMLCGVAAYGQDAPPSLGDVARQARLQKQQKETEAKQDTSAKDAAAKDAASKDASGKDAQGKDGPAKDAQAKDALPKSKRVITNDELPEHIGPTQTRPTSQATVLGYQQPNSTPVTAPAEYWKSQIQTRKNYINSLESQIANLADSIQYAGGNCVSNCVQWNEHQQQKEQQLENMKTQLDQQQKSLEELQDMARKQGFGSSVYDP